MRQLHFRLLFVLGPLLMCSLVPSLMFGMINGQWGSNIIWGSYFGIGWCLAATATGGLVHNNTAAFFGIAYGWFALIPLYLASGWLWRRLGKRGHWTAAVILMLSFLPMVPADTMMGWEGADGSHLPDYSLHLAESN